MVAGSIRRKVKDTKPITWEDIALKCNDITESRDSCLIALLYLSGRRISEVLELQKKKFKIEEKRISFECFNEKVYRKKPTGNFQIQRNFVANEEIVERYYERIRPHWRTNTDSGLALSKFVLLRLGSLTEKDYLFNRLVGGSSPIGRGMAYNIVRFHFPDGWPHLLRHERFTEVFRVYKDDLLSAHRFTFHKRFDSNEPYIRILQEEEEKI